jgi:glycosyltransferase involved in cell wall biosynthesis
MKFLLLTQYFPPEVGAAQARLDAQSREWVRRGHEVEVITCFPNYPEGKIYSDYQGFSKKVVHTEIQRFKDGSIDKFIKIRRFWVYASQGKGVGRLLNYLSFALTALLALFQKRSPDLIFVNSGPLFLGLTGFVYSRFYKVPMVFNVSDLWPRSVEHLASSLSGRLLIRWSEELELWIYKKATFINAITEGVEKILIEEKKVPKEKILRLFNGIDTDLFRDPELNDKSNLLRERLGLMNKFVLIYAGNHGFAHALDKVLLAARRLQEWGENHIGGSEKKKLQELSKEWKLENVLFLDPVPMKDLIPYLKLADLGLVHLKDSALAEETRPAKMFPLLASGLPVVFCGRGEGAQLVQSLKAGEILPPEDPEALAQALVRLQHQKTEFELWSKRGKEFVHQNLSIQKLVADWLEDFQSRMSERAKKISGSGLSSRQDRAKNLREH